MMYIKKLSCLLGSFLLLATPVLLPAQVPAEPVLSFAKLGKTWDEGLPLGNGQLGALIWQKNNAVRFSLDRADLWDERPVRGYNRPEFTFDWVTRQYYANNYTRVKELFEGLYEKDAAPSKIPGAALEIYPSADWGEVTSASVDVFKALAAVQWSSGIRLQSFVSAEQSYGFFRIQKAKSIPFFKLIPPAYEGPDKEKGALTQLGYKQGKVDSIPNGYTYLQEGWDGFKYRVTVYITKEKKGDVEGIWQITSGKEGKGIDAPDFVTLRAAANFGFDYQLTQHVGWWKNFWDQSDIQVPDAVLQKNWYLSQYFLGSTSRKGGTPISLQAIWTADNGKLPPRKGDFHHDLNTQMSYWPAYTANHLSEAMALPDYLDARKETFKNYTTQYFGKEGLNVPGVTSLAGQGLGGWIPYSFSPTTGAGLSHHYYQQWRYSNDINFLKDRGYPWVKACATFLENLAETDSDGKLKLPLSSSPEINENNAGAWFKETTNYDLALMKSVFKEAAIMAIAAGDPSDAEHWNELYEQVRPFALSNQQALKIAPTLAYAASHRHFSHLLGIYPLGIIRWEDGDSTRNVIRQSLHLLDSIGTAQWTGYSFAWLANLKARAKDGEGAVKALQTFSEAFVSPNGFHLNGDQSGKGYSKMTNRSFTLEGNFAFASGLQEMLLQSYSDTVDIMSAIPENWQDVSFKGLRTEGGFLIEARREAGKVRKVIVTAENEGYILVRLPIYPYRVLVTAGKTSRRTLVNGVLKIYLLAGTVMEINPTK